MVHAPLADMAYFIRAKAGHPGRDLEYTNDFLMAQAKGVQMQDNHNISFTAVGLNTIILWLEPAHLRGKTTELNRSITNVMLFALIEPYTYRY